MPILKYSVPTATCGACTATLDGALEEARQKQKLPRQIRSVNFDLSYDPPRAFVDVTENLDPEIVKSTLTELAEEVGHEITPVVPVKVEIYKHLFKGILGLLSGILMLSLCFSGVGLSLLAAYGFGLSLFSTFLTFYLGKETYQEAFKKLKKKELTMHTLFSISTLIALGLSFASFFVPGLPMMFDAALLIFGFVHLGKAFEKSTKNKIVKAASYRTLAPEKILVQTAAGDFKEDFIYNIQPGSVIKVLRGQVIGLDGNYLPEEKEEKLVKKTALLNPYNGSSIPILVKPGDEINAGCVVPEDVDFIQLKVSANEENSYLVFLENQSKATLAKKAPIATDASKLLQYFIPAVLILAFLSAVAIGVFFTPLAALQVAATILASACPCTLGLIIPLAIKIAFIKAFAEGILVKNGETLQAAQKIDTVVFDLNGTLTTGELCVTSGKKNLAPTNLSPPLLSALAAIEQLSNHPFAEAIRNYIHGTLKQPLSSLPKALLIESFHSGLAARIGEKTYIVGNRDLMREHFCEEDISAKDIPGHEAEHTIYFACDGKIEGCILLSDPLRKEAAPMIRALQDEGMEVRICTGTSQETAERYRQQLEKRGTRPIQYVATNCLPGLKKTPATTTLDSRQASEETACKTATTQAPDSKPPPAKTKLNYIEEIQKAGHRVAMIGDGINDAGALEQSDFGIAIDSTNGHQICQEKAGAVIQKKNNKLSLWSIPAIFSIAKHTVKIIKRNMVISLFYNLLAGLAIGGLLVGFGIVAPPAIGAALMFLQSALILASLWRFKTQKLPYANDAVLRENPPVEWESTTRQLHCALPYLEPQPEQKNEGTGAYEIQGKKEPFFFCPCRQTADGGCEPSRTPFTGSWGQEVQIPKLS